MRKIACLMINGVGDIVCVTPALEVLRARYPEADIAVIVRPHLAGLLVGLPSVDRVLPYEVGSAWQRLRYLRELRREQFDLWVDLHMPTFNTVSSNGRDFLRNAFLAVFVGARYRLGYAVPVLKPFLTHAAPVPSADQLRSENIADVTVDLIDRNARRKYSKSIPISAADRTWARHALPDGGGPRIALFFGSRQSASLWSDQKILGFLELLATHVPEAEWVLIGGSFEAELVSRLEPLWSQFKPAAIRNFIGQASFGQTGALLERCEAYVGTDSGPTHMADAIGLPIVALFSTKNHPAIWQPVSRHAIVLFHSVECSPCYLADCPKGNKCMELIAPEEVLAAVLSIQSLGRTPRPQAPSEA